MAEVLAICAVLTSCDMSNMTEYAVKQCRDEVLLSVMACQSISATQLEIYYPLYCDIQPISH